MEENYGSGMGGEVSYGPGFGGQASYGGGGLGGGSVDYSQRSQNSGSGSGARCPGGCSVCKGACRA